MAENDSLQLSAARTARTDRKAVTPRTNMENVENKATMAENVFVTAIRRITGEEKDTTHTAN